MIVNISRSVVIGGLIALSVISCEDAQSPVAPEAVDHHTMTAPPASPSADATLGGELAHLRRATAQFHSFATASNASYDILVTHPTTGAACLDHPTEGGMGRHYLNLNLVDDAVSVTEPEVLIYEPMANGKLRLVAVEYLIPYTIRGPGETPPTLLGREFMHNSTFNLWMLHAYVWKHNPDGLFATWNPDITCEYDALVD